jgi:Transposase DDE domain
VRRRGEGVQDPFVTTDLDTLATALYVRTDDLLKESPQIAPLRPSVGIAPQLSDAELVTLAVLQALLGFTSEARWIRHARAHMRHLFPYLPQQPGYNKRLRAARGLIRHCARALAAGTSLWTDDVWVVDSTPVECARSRETVKRSDLAGWAQYGYCASHSRWFWGLRLHLLCTLHGLPVGFALTGAKADERQVLLGILADDDLARRAGQVIIGDKNYYGRDFERELAAARLVLLRPARKGEPDPAGRQYFKPLRQVIESVNDTFKGQLDLEQHGGRTVDGVTVRILQRILALTAAIWHNDTTGQPVMRSLVAYDH